MPAFESGAEWLRGAGLASDVVVSSRVRLARNLAGFPFQTTATPEQQAEVLDLTRARLTTLELDEPLTWMDLRQVDDTDRELLVEPQLISRQHARGKVSGQPASAASKKDQVAARLILESFLNQQADQTGK